MHNLHFEFSREELKLITEYLGIDNSMVEKVGNTSNGVMGKEEKNMDIDSKIVEGIDTNIMLEKTRLGNFKPEHGNNSFTEKGNTEYLLPPQKTNHQFICSGMSVTRHEVPPLSDGLYYATPVLLADCSESEESDTESDTCQTVIHTSPYSSPGYCCTTSNIYQR